MNMAQTLLKLDNLGIGSDKRQITAIQCKASEIYSD